VWHEAPVDPSIEAGTVSWMAREWAAEQWASTRSWWVSEEGQELSKSGPAHITPAAKLVLFALGDRADKDTLICWPSKRRLARDTGLSERAVPGALKQLVGAGSVDRAKRFTAGRRTSDVFELLIPQTWIDEWTTKNASGANRSSLKGGKVDFTQTRGAPHSVRDERSSPEPPQRTHASASLASSYLAPGSGEGISSLAVEVEINRWAERIGVAA
jgi:hypothetical protein